MAIGSDVAGAGIRECSTDGRNAPAWGRRRPSLTCIQLRALTGTCRKYSKAQLLGTALAC